MFINPPQSKPWPPPAHWGISGSATLAAASWETGGLAMLAARWMHRIVTSTHPSKWGAFSSVVTLGPLLPPDGQRRTFAVRKGKQRDIGASVGSLEGV